MSTPARMVVVAVIRSDPVRVVPIGGHGLSMRCAGHGLWAWRVLGAASSLSWCVAVTNAARTGSVPGPPYMPSSITRELCFHRTMRPVGTRRVSSCAGRMPLGPIPRNRVPVARRSLTVSNSAGAGAGHLQPGSGAQCWGRVGGRRMGGAVERRRAPRSRDHRHVERDRRAAGGRRDAGHGRFDLPRRPRARPGREAG